MLHEIFQMSAIALKSMQKKKESLETRYVWSPWKYAKVNKKPIRVYLLHVKSNLIVLPSSFLFLKECYTNNTRYFMGNLFNKIFRSAINVRYFLTWFVLVWNLNNTLWTFIGSESEVQITIAINHGRMLKENQKFLSAYRPLF